MRHIAVHLLVDTLCSIGSLFYEVPKYHAPSYIQPTCQYTSSLLPPGPLSQGGPPGALALGGTLQSSSGNDATTDPCVQALTNAMRACATSRRYPSPGFQTLKFGGRVVAACEGGAKATSRCCFAEGRGVRSSLPLFGEGGGGGSVVVAILKSLHMVMNPNHERMRAP